MNSLYRPCLVLSLLSISACLQEPRPDELGLQIAVAPLTLPGVGKVCYDLRVTSGPTQNDPTVWAKGVAGLNGGTADAGAICSSSFGNGTGGDITFVGACASSPVDVGQDYRTNSVTLWLDGLYDTSNVYISPTGVNGWRNPCPDGCTLTAPCRENADSFVEFNLTILREANQGFFDIGVNFEDIFCAAKVDCQNESGQPLNLLFRPGTSTRDTTVVAAFACTAGPNVGSNTVLYRDPLKITCGATSLELDPALGKGNAWTSDPNAGDAVFQYATYVGNEALTCNGQPCNKRYWNVAIGLNTTAQNCTLTTSMTASNGELSSFETPTNTTYPYISVNVPLTGASGLTCTRHPLDGSNGVSTTYTSISAPVDFTSSFDGTKFSSEQAIVAPNLELYLTLGTPSSTGLLSGATWLDQSTKARNATLRGTVNRVTVDDMPAFYLNGNSAGSGDIRIPAFYGNVMAGDNTHTYEAWIYLGTNSNTGALDPFNMGSCGGSCIAYLESGSFFDGTGNTGVDGGVLKAGWHHYVLVQQANVAKVYRDGVYQRQNTSFITPPSVTGDIIVGSRAWANRQQNWYLNRMRYYSTSLSDAQVKQNYDAEKALFQRIVTSDLQIHIDAGNHPSYRGTGSTISNLITAGESFSLSGAPTYSTLGSGSLTFNGSTQFIDFGNQSQLYSANLTEFTDEFVFRMPAWGAVTSRALIRVDDWSRYAVGFTPTSVNFRIGYTTYPLDNLTVAQTLATDTWHHLAVVFKSGQRQEIYLDGVQIGTRIPVQTSYGSMPTSGGANIGRGHTAPYSEYLAGHVALYRHYGRALAASELQRNASAAAIRFPD